MIHHPPKKNDTIMVTWPDHQGRMRTRACRVLAADGSRFKVNLGGKNGTSWIACDETCWRRPTDEEAARLAAEAAEMARLRAEADRIAASRR